MYSCFLQLFNCKTPAPFVLTAFIFLIGIFLKCRANAYKIYPQQTNTLPDVTILQAITCPVCKSNTRKYNFPDSEVCWNPVTITCSSELERKSEFYNIWIGILVDRKKEL